MRQAPDGHEVADVHGLRLRRLRTGPSTPTWRPIIFIGLEFLRLDGDDFATHWKEWYPEMTAPEKPVKDLTPGPALGPKFSDAVALSHRLRRDPGRAQQLQTAV